jgi:hypothetical protein
MTSHASHQHPLIPASFVAVDARLRAIIAVWHERETGITDWQSCLAAIDLPGPVGWARTTEMLQMINTYQWHEEDKSREHGAGDALLGAIKRSIDVSNRRRVQTVDQLDDLIFTGFGQLGCIDPDAPLHSESPASIIDRLTVLALKLHHVNEAQAALSDASAEAVAMAGRLATLREQYADLGDCLDRLLGGVRAGQVGLKLYRQVKLYKDPATGRMVADLD